MLDVNDCSHVAVLKLNHSLVITSNLEEKNYLYRGVMLCMLPNHIKINDKFNDFKYALIQQETSLCSCKFRKINVMLFIIYVFYRH